MGPCSRSVHITFTVRLTKQHPVNISFLEKLVQRGRVRVNKALVLVHSCFNSYAHERVPILIFCR